MRTKAADAILAEASAVLHGAERRRGLVELYAMHSRIDLQADDGLDVLAPDWIVPIHIVAVLICVGRFDPPRMVGYSVEATRGAFLKKVGYLLSVAVDETVW